MCAVWAYINYTEQWYLWYRFLLNIGIQWRVVPLFVSFTPIAKFDRTSGNTDLRKFSTTKYKRCNNQRYISIFNFEICGDYFPRSRREINLNLGMFKSIKMSGLFVWITTKKAQSFVSKFKCFCARKLWYMIWYRNLRRDSSWIL